MKRIAAALLALGISFGASAQKEEIVKTGLNFGPLPIVGYDADKGFQYGASLSVYDYGDGTSYPNYNSKTYLETSFTSKGTSYYCLTHDNKALIPGVRWSSALSLIIDKAMDFYGFNGYTSWIDQERLAAGDANRKETQDPAMYKFTPYYRFDRFMVLGKSDFTGRITDNLSWEAGYHFMLFRQNPIDRASLNKGKPDYDIYPDSMPTLFEQYRQWGLISDEEADGGIVSSVRLGLMYDTRDKEGAPTRGTWAEGHLIAAPRFLGSTIGFSRLSATFRQYYPIVENDVLTFAYRLNYEGTIGRTSPYYVLPFMTVMGENFDKEGMGSYRTVRGILRGRAVGLDMATCNAELRWRFTHFRFRRQNIALGLSAFSDGTMVTRGRDMSYAGKPDLSSSANHEPAYNYYMGKGRGKDMPHVTFGSGFRFIMNENFIVAFEYGTPLTHLMKKTNPLYNQDGTGAFYINIGYLF